MFGASLAKFDCLGKTAAEVQDLLRGALEAAPAGVLMLCGKSFQFDALGVAPHRDLLNAICPDIPVFIDSADLHSAWLNSAALAAVGITRDSPDPKGGEFVRDADGEPTGLCLETAVFEHTWPWVAQQLTTTDRIKMLDAVFEEYLSTGVTAAVEMALTEQDLPSLEAIYARDGKLPIRVACHFLMRPEGTDEFRAEQVRSAAAHRARLADCAPWLTIAGIKVISDGVVDSCTAYLTKPYANGATPEPIWPSDELTKVVVLADDLGLQIAVHAIGDAASEQALDAFEAASAANGERDRRHRMEHLEVVSNESIQRLTRLGIIASLQPVHADPVFMTNWRIQLGHDHRCDRAFPWSEYREAG
jgi:predicted amidohydrolase YtcJ